MKPFAKIIAAVALVAGSTSAMADRQVDFANVLSSTPIYETISKRVPVEQCRIETVRYEVNNNRRSSTGTIVGSLIGGAIGNRLGNGKSNKRVGAVAGALLGASIANDISRSRSRNNSQYVYEDVERCDTYYEVEQFDKLVGYDVTYEYNGNTYRTRTSRDPGDQIKIAVSVRPLL